MVVLTGSKIFRRIFIRKEIDMKKLSITMMAIFTVLFSGIFLTGCNNDPVPDTGETDNIQGNLLILQAYGNAGDGSPAGVSHSFVELYNISDEAINLSGISLYYANGTTVASGETNDATEDGPWANISLDGKSIPAKGSFLIVGAKHGDLSDTRYTIADGDGDINDNNLSLSRRGFKVALIKGTAPLTVQNPFTSDGSGKPVSGYIDMVGAANEYDEGRDLIFGFETAPARCSASVAVRRTDIILIDTDDNSKDFTAARYALTGDGAFSDEMLELRKPRNSDAGQWDPFAKPAGSGDDEDPVTAGSADSLAGKLLILQAYSSSSSAAGASHSFVELYNVSDEAIDLSGISLYYADGTTVSSGNTNTATEDGQWAKISLDGKSIPAKGSFLILGPKESTTARYQIPDNSGDINDSNFTLSNRAFKAALIRNDKILTAQNPFNMGSGAKAEGYIDMVGAANEYGTRDLSFGFETAPTRNSASEAARRQGLIDTDDNSADFIAARYASDGMSNEMLELRKPRNSDAGQWDPFAEPEPSIVTEGSATLMILQANTYGNDNGGGGGFPSSLVELYNNTDAAINLTNYYLHIGSAAAWTHVIALTGSIPAKSSFLVVSTSDHSTSGQRDLLPAADQGADFAIANTNFKIALMRNQSSILSVDNPFGEQSLTNDYVDMLGTGTANGYETATASASRPQGPRRTSLTDTDNNRNDFTQIDYRGTSAGNGMADSELYKYWPRNAAGGAWNPITGE
jgi:hypothetical protein